MKTMREILSETEGNKEKYFEERTNRHIGLVKKYCKRIHDYDKEKFPDIIEQGNRHDYTKFKSPEREPYIDISWYYRLKRQGKKYDVTPEQQKEMDKASAHHINKSPHHPEYHSRVDIPINSKNRDKPVEGTKVDATSMDTDNIAEMVADWCAMSEEVGGTPKKWADSTVNKRWKFTPEQTKLIYKLIEAIW